MRKRKEPDAKNAAASAVIDLEEELAEYGKLTQYPEWQRLLEGMESVMNTNAREACRRLMNGDILAAQTLAAKVFAMERFMQWPKSKMTHAQAKLELVKQRTQRRSGRNGQRS